MNVVPTLTEKVMEYAIRNLKTNMDVMLKSLQDARTQYREMDGITQCLKLATVGVVITIISN